jgi:hypothetical protein
MTPGPGSHKWLEIDHSLTVVRVKERRPDSGHRVLAGVLDLTEEVSTFVAGIPAGPMQLNLASRLMNENA